MNISPLNFNTPYPAFKGKSRELEKAIDRVSVRGFVTPEDKVLIIEKIKNALPNILKPSRYIEEGSHNAVYKITSKYVARVPVKEKLTAQNIGDEFVWGEDKFKSLRHYYGEPVMSLGRFQVLRNICNQLPAGVPEHLAQKFSKNKMKKYYSEKYLPIFSQISQWSYNKIALDLAKLNEMKFGFRNYGVFDSMNPNNIVTGNGNLYLVDEIDTLCDKSYANTTAKLLNVFINRASKDYEAPQMDKEIKFVRKIFKKTVISGVFANLLHADSKEDFGNWEIALKKCKINIPAVQILNKLDEISCSKLSRDEKADAVKEYLTILFDKNPSNK